MANIDIARALKDKDYFDSLTPDEKEQVRVAGGVGSSEITDGDLDSVSGGLEGGASPMATTTTGAKHCVQCSAGSVAEVVCVC